MTARLRPIGPLAADAILVGDPGRSLLLAQRLMEKPKMSNHARGLWGYSGLTPSGAELTIQATGMGGPSAALVLADLAKLGLKRAVRIGTCTAIAGRASLGELLLPTEAIAVGGSATAFGLSPRSAVTPDPVLLDRLKGGLGATARQAAVASLDTVTVDAAEVDDTVAAADMQTVAILARGRELGVISAAVLIVSDAEGETLSDEGLEVAAVRGGEAAVQALSNPKV